MKIIRGGTLIDSTGRPPLRDAVIVVEDGTIKAVREGDDLFPEEEHAELLDARGRTVLPGLIDAHVHLTFNEEQTCVPQLLEAPDTTLVLYAVRNAQSALCAGVTTLRDCGDRGGVTFSLRDAVEEGVLAGPRIVASGPPITTTAGHLHYIGIEADTFDELRKAVRSLVKAGSDFLKICGTGGGMTPGSNVRAAQYSAEELGEVVRDAHRLERRVATHVHGTEGIRNAAIAGIDSLEHCSWLGRTDGHECDDEVIRMIVDKGLYICHTIAGQRRVSEADVERTQKQGPGIPWLFHRKAFDAGAKFVIAGDDGVPGTPFRDFPRSLEVAVKQMGLSPMDAIRSATAVAAEMLGLSHEIGTVEVGKRADLFLVDGEPFEDIAALRRVEWVMRNGEIVASKDDGGMMQIRAR